MSIRTRSAYLSLPKDSTLFLFAPAAVYLFKFNASSPQFHFPSFSSLSRSFSLSLCLLPCCTFYFCFATKKSETILQASPQIMLQICTLILLVPHFCGRLRRRGVAFLFLYFFFLFFFAY